MLDCWMVRIAVIANPPAAEYHLLLALELALLAAPDHDNLARETTEIKRMLTALMPKLNAESLRRSRIVGRTPISANLSLSRGSG
jgi:hypothetical protein